MGGRIRALILVASLVGLGVLAGSALSQRWEVPRVEAAAEAVRQIASPTRRVRVEVLNAGGRPNVARMATDGLREIGFDVVYFGNAERFDRDSSVVLDRVGDLGAARAVADVLGIRTVRSEPDANLFVDVSVLLGAVWEPPLPPAPPPPPPEPAWWDLRRFAPRQEPALPRGGPPGGTMANPNPNPTANPTERGDR